MGAFDVALKNGNTCGVCKVSSSVRSMEVVGKFVGVPESFFDSTARRKVSSNGLTCCKCKSSNSPTSSQFFISRVGVGV